MEPVTHVLTGACLSRTGLNRRAAYATAAMAIAAEFPDIDTVWGFRGPVAGFQHHRGITHTFLGIPFEAALVLAGFFVYHTLRAHKRNRAAEQIAAGTTAPDSLQANPRWGTLYVLLMLALLSHLFLDYTNDYGLRPFFPFDGRWYAGSFVFIFDPLLFVLLLGGLVMPALFGLVSREIGARKERFRGRGWARAALAAAVVLWCVRWFEHSRAVAMAEVQTMRQPGPAKTATGATSPTEGPGSPAIDQQVEAGAAPEPERPLLQAQRSLASPDPLSVFRWYTVTDFGPVYRLGVADTRIGTLVPGRILYKPVASPAIRVAEQTQLGRVYLDWSPMPAITSESGAPVDFAGAAPEDGYSTVLFRDPRFMGESPWSRDRSEPPLTGEVVLDGQDHVLAQGINGHFDRLQPKSSPSR